MKTVLATHFVVLCVLALMWTSGHEVGAYRLWTNVQGPIAALTLARLLGTAHLRRAPGRSGAGAVLLIGAWYLLCAFPFFTPPATRLVGLWEPSAWEVLGLVPVLGVAVPLSTLVSSIAVRVASGVARQTFFGILFWNAIASVFAVLGYNEKEVWLGVPLALAWHVGLIRSMAPVAARARN